MYLALVSLFLTAVSLHPIHDVIIIGAGVSGLRASQVLSHHNISHIIL